MNEKNNTVLSATFNVPCGQSADCRACKDVKTRSRKCLNHGCSNTFTPECPLQLCCCLECFLECEKAETIFDEIAQTRQEQFDEKSEKKTSEARARAKEKHRKKPSVKDRTNTKRREKRKNQKEQVQNKFKNTEKVDEIAGNSTFAESCGAESGPALCEPSPLIVGHVDQETDSNLSQILWNQSDAKPQNNSQAFFNTLLIGLVMLFAWFQTKKQSVKNPELGFKEDRTFFIVTKTVKKHVYRTLIKLGFSSRLPEKYRTVEPSVSNEPMDLFSPEIVTGPIFGELVFVNASGTRTEIVCGIDWMPDNQCVVFQPFVQMYIEVRSTGQRYKDISARSQLVERPPREESKTLPEEQTLHSIFEQSVDLVVGPTEMDSEILNDAVNFQRKNREIRNGWDTQSSNFIQNEDFFSCERPGCKNHFPFDPRVPHQSYCGRQCFEALRRARSILNRVWKLTGCPYAQILLKHLKPSRERPKMDFS